jgi:hypothetical protein
MQYAVVVTKARKGSSHKKDDILETAKTKKELDYVIEVNAEYEVKKINVTLAE